MHTRNAFGIGRYNWLLRNLAIAEIAGVNFDLDLIVQLRVVIKSLSLFIAVVIVANCHSIFRKLIHGLTFRETGGEWLREFVEDRRHPESTGDLPSGQQYTQMDVQFREPIRHPRLTFWKWSRSGLRKQLRFLIGFWEDSSHFRADLR
jgi:hypothetical protein